MECAYPLSLVDSNLVLELVLELVLVLVLDLAHMECAYPHLDLLVLEEYSPCLDPLDLPVSTAYCLSDLLECSLEHVAPPADRFPD